MAGGNAPSTSRVYVPCMLSDHFTQIEDNVVAIESEIEHVPVQVSIGV